MLRNTFRLCVVGREKENEEGQENVHPHGNVLETDLPAENVLQDGHAESYQDILCSSPSSPSMGTFQTNLDKCAAAKNFFVIFSLVFHYDIY